MEYDPLKNKLAKWLEVIPGLRLLLFKSFDLLLLRQRYVKREINRLFPVSEDAAFYDAGAGFCQYSWYVLGNYPRARVLATDLKLDYLDSFALFAKHKVGDRFRHCKGDLQTYLPADKYDMAVAIDILEHIPDDLAVMKNLAQALKPQGTLIISTPSNTDEAARFTGEHVRPGYDKAELEAKLVSCGFQIVSSKYNYGRWGHLAWLLLMKHPLKLIHNKMWPLLLPYYLLAYPLAELLMQIDLHMSNPSGTGIIVVCRK